MTQFHKQALELPSNFLSLRHSCNHRVSIEEHCVSAMIERFNWEQGKTSVKRK